MSRSAHRCRMRKALRGKSTEAVRSRAISSAKRVLRRTWTATSDGEPASPRIRIIEDRSRRMQGRQVAAPSLASSAMRRTTSHRRIIESLDIAVAARHIASVGPPAVARLSQGISPKTATRPRAGQRTFGDMSNLHRPFIWWRQCNPGFRQPPGELSRAAKRYLTPQRS